MRADPPEPWILRRRLEVGARMRALRERSRLSQERLAEAVGVDRKVINRLETGATAMTVDQAAYIARALHCPMAWLFTDEWATQTEDHPPDCASDT